MKKTFELPTPAGSLERLVARGITVAIKTTSLPDRVVVAMSIDLVAADRGDSAGMVEVRQFLQFCLQNESAVRRGKHEFSPSEGSFFSDLWSHPAFRRAHQWLEENGESPSTPGPQSTA